MVGLGLHNGEAGLPDQEGRVNVQDGSIVIALAEREGTEGDGSCWKVGRHPDTINRRFSHPVTLLEGDW